MCGIQTQVLVKLKGIVLGLILESSDFSRTLYITILKARVHLAREKWFCLILLMLSSIRFYFVKSQSNSHLDTYYLLQQKSNFIKTKNKKDTKIEGKKIQSIKKYLARYPIYLFRILQKIYSMFKTKPRSSKNQIGITKAE